MSRNGTCRSDNPRPQNDPQTIDGETGKPLDTPQAGSGRRRRIDLTTLKDVRLELSIVYRKMDSGEIKGAEGTKRAYVLKTIADVITLADLEQRIGELEERQGLTLPAHPQLPARAVN